MRSSIRFSLAAGILCAAVTALVVLGKHLDNLKRLARGEERKLGAK